MKQELVIDDIPGECRVALLEDDIVVEVDIDRTSHHSQIGNIYWGRADSVVASLQAAFLTLDDGPQGFLSVRESQALYPPDGGRRPRIETIIHEGQWVLVQVTKDAVGDKGPRLTANPSLAGRFLVAMPQNPRAGGVSRRIDGEDRDEVKKVLSELTMPEGMGVIVRTAGVGRSTEEMQWDLDYLTQVWSAIERAAGENKAPFLIYQESNIVIRALRDPRIRRGRFESQPCQKLAAYP